MGVIYITHRLEELRAVGDRVTILRDGNTVHTGAARRDHHRPHHQVHGGPRDGVASTSAIRMPPGEELLRVEGLSRDGQAGRCIASRCAPARSSGSPAWWAPGARNCAAPSSASTPSTPAASSWPAREVRIRSPREAVARGHRAGHRGPPAHRPLPAAARQLTTSRSPTSPAISPLRDCSTSPPSSAPRREYTERLRIRAASRKQLAGQPERRQPAEGRHRQVAVPQGARVPLRRAHARHRRGRQGRGLRGHGSNWRAPAPPC